MPVGAGVFGAAGLQQVTFYDYCSGEIYDGEVLVCVFRAAVSCANFYRSSLSCGGFLCKFSQFSFLYLRGDTINIAVRDGCVSGTVSVLLIKFSGGLSEYFFRCAAFVTVYI